MSAIHFNNLILVIIQREAKRFRKLFSGRAQNFLPKSDDRVGIVGLKAVLRISAHWRLSDAELIALTDIPDNIWQLAIREEFGDALSRDQLLRLSAIVGIYKAVELYFGQKISSRWVTLPNTGPLFSGARPIDVMIRDGVPVIIGVRHYLDDL